MRSIAQPTSIAASSEATGQPKSNECPSTSATKSANTSAVSGSAPASPAKRKPGMHKGLHPWHGISLSHKENAAMPPANSRLVRR